MIGFVTTATHQQALARLEGVIAELRGQLATEERLTQAQGETISDLQVELAQARNSHDAFVEETTALIADKDATIEAFDRMRKRVATEMLNLIQTFKTNTPQEEPPCSGS